MVQTGLELMTFWSKSPRTRIMDVCHHTWLLHARARMHRYPREPETLESLKAGVVSNLINQKPIVDGDPHCQDMRIPM